jgi:type I restriction enzyme R subunit
VDAIGVTKSLKTASQPLITKPSVPLKDLAMGVMMGVRDADTVSSLAGRLARLNSQIDEKDQQRINEKSGGVDLSTIIGNLISAIDSDNVDAKAREMNKLPSSVEPDEKQYQTAQESLIDEAAKVFNGELIELLDNIRRDKEQTIDHENLDNVQFAGWDGDAKENAAALVKDFQEYLEENRDNIEALTIFYSQPARRREITYDMIRQVMDSLRADRPKLAPARVWQAYAVLDEYKGEHHNHISELTALVSLIRRACGIDKSVSRHSDTVRRNFQNWIMKHHSGGKQKFNKEQMQWLQMTRDHIISSFHLERDDLEAAPFDAKGGMGKMHQIFGDEMDSIIDELNEALAA